MLEDRVLLSAGDIEWIRQFGTATTDRVNAIVSDGVGGVYVVGTTDGTLPGQTSTGGQDVYVRRYAADGTEVWTRQFGTPSDDYFNALVSDGAGGVYVAGNTTGTLPGQTSAGDYDAYVRRYAADGTEVWTRQFGAPGYDSANTIVQDGAGGIYVAGSTYGTLGQTTAGGQDVYVRRYAADGTEVWTRQFGSSDSDLGYIIVQDGTGGVYVAGITFGTLPGQTFEGNYDAYVRRYAADGTEVWTRQFGSSSTDVVNMMVQDGDGGVYVAGNTYGTLGQTTAGGQDAYVRRYAADGTEVWTRQFGAPKRPFPHDPGSLFDSADALVSDGAGGVYVAGDTTGTLPGQTSTGDYYDFDAYVRRYAADGSEIWTRQFGTPSDNYFKALVSDGTGGVYVAGTTTGTLPNVRQYAADGTEVWTRQFGATSSDTVNVIKSDGAGGVYVAGSTTGTLSGQTAAGGRDVYVIKYQGKASAPNTPPMADAGGPYAIAEGDGLTLDAADSTDPDSDFLTYSWDVNGDGVFGDATGVAPALTWTQLRALGLDGPNSYSVAVRVADGHGNVDTSAPATLTVANTAPTATLTNNGPVFNDEPVTVRFINPYDLSSADMAAGLRYAFATTSAALDSVTYASASPVPSVSFTFAESGAHNVYGRVFDKDGGVHQYSTIVQVTSLAPAVVATTVNAGAAQRSNIETIALRFNRSTNLPDLIADDSISNAVQLVGTDQVPLDLKVSRFHYDAATLTLMIDLTTDGFGGSQATMLADGRYQLQLDTALITTPGSASTALTDNDGVADGLWRYNFHRLEGDFDGNALVDLADRASLLTHYGSRVGQSAYDFAYDLNGDGVINLADYLLWSRRLGQKV